MYLAFAVHRPPTFVLLPFSFFSRLSLFLFCVSPFHSAPIQISKARREGRSETDISSSAAATAPRGVDDDEEEEEVMEIISEICTTKKGRERDPSLSGGGDDPCLSF